MQDIRKVEKKGEELEDSRGGMILGPKKIFRDLEKYQSLRNGKNSLLKDKGQDRQEILTNKR